MSSYIQTLKKKLAKDKEEPSSLYFLWQSNIAMAFYDEYNKQIGEGCAPVNASDINSVANAAAKNFLDLLINEE